MKTQDLRDHDLDSKWTPAPLSGEFGLRVDSTGGHQFGLSVAPTRAVYPPCEVVPRNVKQHIFLYKEGYHVSDVPSRGLANSKPGQHALAVYVSPLHRAGPDGGAPGGGAMTTCPGLPAAAGQLHGSPRPWPDKSQSIKGAPIVGSTTHRR
jgi:hypothetical protein